MGSRRAAKAMTSAGTRNPTVSSSTTASGLPRCIRQSRHEVAAHGVVPCARSPSTVAEPVLHRRPTARSCIADRSCASSITTWPRLGIRVSRSDASSSSATSAADHRACPALRGGASHRSRRCSASSSTPFACSARKRASDSSRKTSLTGSRAGHIASAHALTGRVRATAS